MAVIGDDAVRKWAENNEKQRPSTRTLASQSECGGGAQLSARGPPRMKWGPRCPCRERAGCLSRATEEGERLE